MLLLHRVLWALVLAGLAAAQDGAALYKQNCAMCHDGGMDRAPSRSALQAMTADRVLAALETGPMISMASRRTAAERRTIAEFVTGKALGSKLVTTPPPEAMCSSHAADFAHQPAWIGWGSNLGNTRFRDAAEAGLTADQVPRLKVKWAFGFPGD
jgi:polyvinyl alcohol dehydrogenase (cytochrome)